jgi:small subunit ribosomal protein S5
MVIFKREISLDDWVPRTELGKKVKAGEITDLNVILDAGMKILESEIVDMLVPDLDLDLLEVGQSKGKFGGGKSSIWKQTQKKTSESNIIKFTAFAVVGDKNGFIGLGLGSARETVPAREKAIRKAKLNIINIKKGCGSWACGCGNPHSLPYRSEGKAGSVRVTLKPAPRGTGLVVPEKCKRIMELAGFTDVYSKTIGQAKTRINLFQAFFDALKNITNMRVGNK